MDYLISLFPSAISISDQQCRRSCLGPEGPRMSAPSRNRIEDPAKIPGSFCLKSALPILLQWAFLFFDPSDSRPTREFHLVYTATEVLPFYQSKPQDEQEPLLPPPRLTQMMARPTSS